MTISLIVAMSRERAIGVENKLPWHLPPDLKRFKTLTNGHPMIMGRKTFESIGKPLPGRTSIVLSRSANAIAGAVVVNSWDAALEAARAAPGNEEIFVIGGGEIFAMTLPQADRVYLTHIEMNVPNGDAFFPELPVSDWLSAEKNFYPATDETPGFLFETLERKR